MTFGENLKELRKASGLSQEEVAQKLYLSRQSVSKWENGDAEPGIEHLKELAQLYGVTLDRLLTGAEPEQVETPGVGEIELKTKNDVLYLRHTVILVVFTLVIGLFTAVTQKSVNIPFSVIAVILGLWVIHPAVWVIIECLFAVNAILSVVGLFYGNIDSVVILILNLVYMWLMSEPMIKERFGVKNVR